MELPSPRELELETLLRQRDAQLAELTDEVIELRRHVVADSPPSTSDSMTIPPPLMAILLPHISSAGTTPAGATSGTVTAALTQRARLLQEENDELYGLLKFGETGKLKEEVRCLRRLVERLESALRDSQLVISSLSTELEKSYETLMTTARHSNNVADPNSFSQSPRNSHHSTLHSGSTNNGGPLKPPPTEPRAYKRPRLSESHSSPPREHVSLPRKPPSNHPVRDNETREYAPRHNAPGRVKSNHHDMEVDEDLRPRQTSPSREREREREKDRSEPRGVRGREREYIRERERAPPKDRDRDRERERDRDGNKVSRRNGAGTQRPTGGNNGAGAPRTGNGSNGSAAVRNNSGINTGGSGGGNVSGGAGSGGRRNDRGIPPSKQQLSSGDRTLAERMGL